MRMKTLGYYNGTYDELENMMVPFDDRVCFFGDGVYDRVRQEIITCLRSTSI